MSWDEVFDHLAAKPRVRVLYTDLDGTLLGPNGSLLTAADGRPSARAAAALAAAADGGLLVVPVSGRLTPQLANDARLMGLRDFIAEAGSVVVRDGGTVYSWGEAPRDLADDPHSTLVVSGALEALLTSFPDDVRIYEPWNTGRQGDHILHGAIDVALANKVLADAGAGWAQVIDNGATGGWPGRSVRAYHLLARGVGKAQAVAQDLLARGLQPDQAAAIGDSPEDLRLAGQVGTYFQVANGSADVAGVAAAAFVTPGAMGAGFAEAVDALLTAAH